MPPETYRAVIFADLAGFTALTEAHGDHDAMAVAVRFKTLGDSSVVGTTRLIKTIGDALMFAADDMTDALDTGLALLNAVDAEPSFPGVRIGVHGGKAIERDGDLFGATVNLTARVAEQARSGQLLTTEAAARAINSRDDLRARALGEVQLKHIALPVAIFSVDEDSAPARLPFGGREYYFCSLRCARTFIESPDRYT